VRILGDDPEGQLAASLASLAADLERYTSSRYHGAAAWRLEVGRGTRNWLAQVAGPPPEVEVLVSLLPAAEEVRELSADLPVELRGSVLTFAGRRHDEPGVSLGVKLMPRGRPENRWWVVGASPAAVRGLTAEVILSAAGLRVEGWDLAQHYVLRGSALKRRVGHFRRDRDGNLRADDLWNDFASGDEWFSGLTRAVDGSVAVLGGHRPYAVNSLHTIPYDKVPPPRFLAPLYRSAVDRMVRRLGVAELADQLASDPLTVVLERDHVEQIRHAGQVGTAVAGERADLHVVLHPADDFAIHQALALAVLRRAGYEASAELPPYLLHGAALWLSGVPEMASDVSYDRPKQAWYCWDWRQWPGLLARAGVLPTLDELLAEEPPADGSFLLWTPLAAAVIDAVPGATLAERLHEPRRLRAAAGRLLNGLDGREGPLTAAMPCSPRRADDFFAGVSLEMLNDQEMGYHSPSVTTALRHLRSTLHADAVSLMPFAFQSAPDQPAMRYLNRHPRGETDTAMIYAGRQAGYVGLRVLWKPQIWLRDSWPGEVAMTSEEDWRAWFRAYRRFLVHQAVLAQWTGAEVFSVGVELGKTMPRQADWHRLIAAVGTVYEGPLTYSANWHGDFDHVPFWDKMDYLGVNAYEPLTGDPAADDRALADGARRVVANLRARARRHGKPLLLTEVGFAAHEAAWVAPHEEGETLSHEDQARAYRALLGALPAPGEADWLGGAFVWKADSSASLAAPGGRLNGRLRDDAGERADLRFLHRPAQEVIRGYYGESEAPRPPG